MIAWLQRIAAEARSGDWLDRQRVRGYARIVLAIEIVGMLFLIAGTHGLIVKLDRPNSTDFVSFYAAGALADAGAAPFAYDRAAHHAAEARATAPWVAYVYFYYPPTYLLICAGLATLPYLAAFLLFEAATLVAWLAIARATLGERGGIVPLLAFPAAMYNLGIGQNAFLSAAIFGAALMLVDRRPLAAGLLFGALSYKPHLGLLIPVALAAGGHWRAFAAAAASVAGTVALSVICFGTAAWYSFFAATLGAPALYQSGNVDFSMLVTPFGGTLLAGGGPPLAYAVQAVATLAAAALVALVWRRRLSLPVRAAALAAATPVAVPVLLTYDLVLAAIAALWLVRAARHHGFLPWEKTVLVGLFLIPLVQRGIGHAWHLPLGPLGLLALLALVAARAIDEMQQRRAAASGFAGGYPA